MVDEIHQLLEYIFQLTHFITRPLARSQSLAALSEVYFHSGGTGRGLEIVTESLIAADQIKRPEEKARQLAWIARVYAEAGQKEKAGEQFQRALLLSRATVTPEQKIGALYYVASEYADAGWQDEAEQVLVALKQSILSEGSEVDVACELINIAEIYADIGSQSKAVEILQETVPLIGSLKDNWFKAERFVEAGGLLISIKEMEKALPVLDEALRITLLIEETHQPYFYLKIFDAYINADHPTEAFNILERTRHLIKLDEPSLSLANDLRETAVRFARLDHSSTAADLLYQAYAVIEKVDNLKEKIAGLIQLCESFADLTLNEKSIEIVNRVSDLVKTLQDSRTRLYFLGQLIILNVHLKQPDKSSELVQEIVQMAHSTNFKTSGLGAIANELAEAGAIDLALGLTGLIREPEIKAESLMSITHAVIESKSALSDPIRQLISQILRDSEKSPYRS